MTQSRATVSVFLGAVFALAAFAQQPSPTPPASSVKTVEVKASVAEAEVGQQVKLTVVAKDAAGNVVNEQPSASASIFRLSGARNRMEG